MPYDILTKHDIEAFGAKTTGATHDPRNFLAGLDEREENGWALVFIRGSDDDETFIFHKAAQGRARLIS